MDFEIRVLVVGDSYANFARFEAGIEQAFAARGCNACVMSFSRPGFTTGKLVEAVRKESAALIQQGPFAYCVIVAGVNDIIQRRGASRYARDTENLIALLAPIAKQIHVMQIVNFDEFMDVARLPGRIKHWFHALLRDRAAGRVDRYRAAAANLPNAGLLRTADILPRYDPPAFKDGIHLTDAEFAKLARHIGDQLAALPVPQPRSTRAPLG